MAVGKNTNPRKRSAVSQPQSLNQGRCKTIIHISGHNGFHALGTAPHCVNKNDEALKKPKTATLIPQTLSGRHRLKLPYSYIFYSYTQHIHKNDIVNKQLL